MLFFLDNLQIYQMSVSLQRVFHSIRFKVNKGWVCPHCGKPMKYLAQIQWDTVFDCAEDLKSVV